MSQIINFGNSTKSSTPAINDSIPKDTHVNSSIQGTDNLSLESRINRNHPTIIWHKAFTEKSNNPNNYVSFPPLSKQANGKYIPDYKLNINYPYDDLLRKSLNMDTEGINDLFNKNVN